MFPEMSNNKGKLKRATGENMEVIPTKFTKSKYDPLEIKYRYDDPCDKIVLPKINDRQYSIKKSTQNIKETNFRSSAGLKMRRVKYLKEIVILDEKWKNLEDNERALRQNVIAFNGFLKENLVKKERFVENISHHQETCRKYEEDIREIKGRITIWRQILELMEKQLEKHSIYYNFLKTVVHQKSEFRSVFSLYTRFELLHSTLHRLVEEYNRCKTEVEFLVKEIERKHNENIYVIQSLLHELGVLNQTYITVARRSKESENLLRTVQIETAKFESNFLITKDFINQLYLSICRRQGMEPDFQKGDFQSQLSVIYKTLEILSNAIHPQEKRKQ